MDLLGGGGDPRILRREGFSEAFKCLKPKKQVLESNQTTLLQKLWTVCWFVRLFVLLLMGWSGAEAAQV